MIRWRQGLFSLLWDEFQQDRKCVKNHSHLLQGPMKTECISKMRNCFLSGRALLSHVQEVWESRIIREGKLFRVRAACTLSFKCLRSNDLSVTTSSGSQHCFALPEIQGEVSDCVRLEMPCGMQESGKKRKPLACRPQSWHRLRLWASHNYLGTVVLFCWHVICLQQCADWACLSIVVLTLPLLCPVEHFCISVVDQSCWSFCPSSLESGTEEKRFSCKCKYHPKVCYVLFGSLAAFTNLRLLFVSRKFLSVEYLSFGCGI